MYKHILKQPPPPPKPPPLFKKIYQEQLNSAQHTVRYFIIIIDHLSN